MRPEGRQVKRSEAKMMTSFVETEKDRRAQNRSKLMVPAELTTQEGSQSIYVMELGRQSCRAVITADNQLTDMVSLKMTLPKSGSIQIKARVGWSKELAPRRWQVIFEDFEFQTSTEERTLLSYLNEVMVESGDMGGKALRALGSAELKRLSRLVKASRTLDPCQSYLEAIKQVIDVTRKSLSAERGLFLVDRGEDFVAVEVASGTAAIKARGLGFSKTVVQTVADTGQPLLSLDAQTDQALGAVSSIRMLGTVSVMCVPMVSKNRRFGYLYVDNSMSKGLFKDSDLALVTILADLAAASLEKNRDHLLGIQSERVVATQNTVKELSRKLKPKLSSMDGSAGEECLALLDSLLSKKSPEAPQAIDLMDVFEDLALRSGENADFPLPPPSGWSKIQGQKDDFLRIFDMLLQASQSDGKGRSEVTVVVDKSELRVTIANKEQSMTPRDLERIYSSSDKGRLAEVQRLVHHSGGLIRVYPGPDGGVVFTVEFPVES